MWGLGGLLGGAQASSTSPAPAVADASPQQVSTGASSKPKAAAQEQVDSELVNVYVPIDPDVRAYQSTADLDNRLAERGFDSRRAWEHVTLDDVAREMDDLKMDKDVDENILTDIRKSFDILTKATVMPRSSSEKRKMLTPSRLSEIENRLNNDPSLQLDDEDAAMAPDGYDGQAAAEVKKKLVRAYTKIKKSSYDLSQVTTHQIEYRIGVLRDK